eukprot:639191-Prymnesium_polylepis.1
MSEDDRVRGPPCVALQSKESKAAPDRDTQYTFVPEAYRIEHPPWPQHRACLCHSKLLSIVSGRAVTR